MYLSALGGVVASIALWNLMTAGETPAPEVRHAIQIGDFREPGGGLQQELLELLDQLPALEVQAMGVEETADFTIDGSIEATDDGWTVAARLLDQDEGHVLWSDKVVVEGGAPRDAGRRVAGAVARTLKLRFPKP